MVWLGMFAGLANSLCCRFGIATPELAQMMKYAVSNIRISHYGAQSIRQDASHVTDFVIKMKKALNAELTGYKPGDGPSVLDAELSTVLSISCTRSNYM